MDIPLKASNVTTLWQCARINDATGNIMICRNNRISLYSLNGAELLDQVVSDRAGDCILSCAFYEGLGNEWLERELLFTGHRRGLVNVSFPELPHLKFAGSHLFLYVFP